MRTWKDLGAEFRALEGGRPDARLDYQWGSSGEHWRLAAVTGRSYPTRFDALAEMAGTKLLSHPLATADAELLNEPNAVTRWYRALVRLSGRFRHGIVGQELGSDGSTVGHIFTGSVDCVSEAASDLCLTLEAKSVSTNDRLVELAVPKYAGPHAHWQEACRLQGLDEPDLAGAVHEAVSAVEGMVRLILAMPNVTLGRGAEALRQKGLLHGSLVKCLDSIWGYSSAVPGIRHGADRPQEVRADEAEFVIDVCEACLRLLLSTSRQQ